MIQANVDIRRMARANDVPLYAIADKLGISQAAFFIKLRYELDITTKEKIKEIISNLSEVK